MDTPDRYRVELPWPVSANDLWTAITISGRPRMMLTKEGRKFKDDVGWLARKAGIVRPIPGRVGIRVEVYPRIPKDAEARMRKFGDKWEDDVHCMDIDNVLKATIDGLKNIAFNDDKMVWAISCVRMPPRDKAGLLVDVVRIPYIEPQLSLFDLP